MPGELIVTIAVYPTLLGLQTENDLLKKGIKIFKRMRNNIYFNFLGFLGETAIKRQEENWKKCIYVIHHNNIDLEFLTLHEVTFYLYYIISEGYRVINK